MVGPTLLFWAVATAALAADPAQTNPDQVTVIGEMISQHMRMTSILLEDIKLMTMDMQVMSLKINDLENKMAEVSNEVKEIKDTQTEQQAQGIAEQLDMVRYLYNLGMNKTLMLEDMAAGIEHLVSNDVSGCAKVAVYANKGSGVYTMRGGVKMYCDIEGGEGWTVIQRRHSGPQSFDKNWTDYKNGFGDLNGEFWLGNEKIHAFTSRKPHMIQFVLEDCGDHGDRLVADYSTFSVGNETSGYRLTIEGYSGNATDGMNGCTLAHANHNGMQFSTRDKDNDQWSDGNCAVSHGAAGWWYNRCYCSHLNRQSGAPYWNNDKISCKALKMRIKPLSN